MSSKRGRKRNDNLPPNRARDVQRAFRARRAAHLDALEQRVAELEEENDTLRAALNLPPGNRPALGKGPTGKDKPKPYAPRQQSLSSNPPLASSSGLPPSSRTDSPSSTSTRTHSLSPTAIAAALNNSGHSVQSLESSNAWEEAMMRKERSEAQPSPISTGYPITPVSTSSTQPPFSYPNSSTSSSRQSTMASMYMQPLTQNYPHSSDRPTDNYSDCFLDRRYSFSQSAFSTAHDSNVIHAHSPTSAVPSIPQRGNHLQHPVSYAHRRSITESQGYRPVVINQPQVPNLPHAQQHSAHVVRIPSPSGLPDTVASLRAEYDLESRVGRMS